MAIKEGTCSIGVVPSLAIDGDRIASAVASVGVVASMSVTPLRVRPGACSVDAVASLAVDPLRVRPGAVAIAAVSSLDIAGLAYVTQSLSYGGTLRGGDVLEIDVDKMSVKLNGVDVRVNFSGIFPLLYTGTNELRWWDRDTRYGRFGTSRFGRSRFSGASAPRDVDLEVVHRPRYL